jgi:hypothetical protein
MSLGRLLAMGLAVIGWSALILQLIITIGNTLRMGDSALDGVFNFLSYFTVLTNLLIAVSLTVPLVRPQAALARFFEQPATRTALAGYIIVVGVVYAVALSELWDPQGAQFVADLLLHTVVPIVYVAYWLFCVPKGSLSWRNIFSWPTYPLAYLAYALVRGAVVGRYPYPFIDVNVLGYPQVLLNALGLLAAFLVLGLIFVALDRTIGRLGQRSPQPIVE